MNYYGYKESLKINLPEEKRVIAKIATPADLYKALEKIWCAATCAPRMRDRWSEDNRTVGQCSITAFLVQDIFGGIVKGLQTPSGNTHCYNVIDGIVFDLTSEQFGEEAKELIYAPEDPVQDRNSQEHFCKTEKLERYEYLKRQLYSPYSLTYPQV